MAIFVLLISLTNPDTSQELEDIKDGPEAGRFHSDKVHNAHNNKMLGLFTFF